MNSQVLAIRRLLFRRSAYRRLFCEKDGFGPLKADAQVVLADLIKVSRFRGTIIVVNNGVVDTHASFAAEGMRSLLARIIDHIHLDDTDLVAAEKALRQAETNMGAPTP